MASKFPQYTFEEILDKTPAWLSWVCLQAINLDGDLARKLGAIAGFGAPAAAGPAKLQPRDRGEENKALRAMGVKVGR